MAPEATGTKRMDFNDLLEDALEEMKINQTVAPAKTVPAHEKSMELEAMIEEFKNATSAGRIEEEELPAKIDAALDRLLNMVILGDGGSLLIAVSLNPTLALEMQRTCLKSMK